MKMEFVLNENVLSSKPKDCSTPKQGLGVHPKSHSVEHHERSSVQVLHESTNSLAGGKERIENENRKEENKPKVKILYDRKSSSTSSGHSMKIYEDSNTSEDSSCVRCSRSAQTEDVLLESFLQSKQLQNVNVSTDSGHLSGFLDPEAYDLMVNENIPENYWKMVAEQRKDALNETLEENERLSFEVEQLKDENRRLSDIASKATYLENILSEVLSDTDDKGDDKESEEAGCSHLDKDTESEHLSAVLQVEVDEVKDKPSFGEES